MLPESQLDKAAGLCRPTSQFMCNASAFDCGDQSCVRVGSPASKIAKIFPQARARRRPYVNPNRRGRLFSA